MLLVLFENHAEMIDCVLKSALFARNTTKLKVSICFVAIDLDRMLKTRDRFRVLSSVLVDQSELIMCVGIARIDRRRFHRASEALPLPERKTNVANVTTKHAECIKEEKRREEKGRHRSEEFGLHGKRQRSDSDEQQSLLILSAKQHA